MPSPSSISRRSTSKRSTSKRSISGHFTERFPRPRAAKVPEITALFWLIKVLTTGMGEAASDYLGQVDIALAGAVGLLGFVVAMWLQFRSDRYVAGVYWFAVAMVAVFGTMAADALHKGLDIPYIGSTIFYAIVLSVVFALWYRSEGTLSIHTVTTRKREIYYWITVLATFALGTAAGDLTAATMGLGFLNSGFLFAVIMVIPALGWWKFRLNAVIAFWFAYVITRPLGASFADWMGKPAALTGLGWGDGPVTAVTAVVIICLVAYLAKTRSDIQKTRSGIQTKSDIHQSISGVDSPEFAPPTETLTRGEA